MKQVRRRRDWTTAGTDVISGVTVKQVRRRRDRATAGTDVISGVTVKQVRRRRHRATAGRCSGGNEAGRAFVVNLALSDLIVATLINPLAIAGLYKKGKVFQY